jgi:hypothetical protein
VRARCGRRARAQVILIIAFLRLQLHLLRAAAQVIIILTAYVKKCAMRAAARGII